MQVEVYHKPVFHLVMKNFFDKDISEAILKEAVKNRNKFKQATTFNGADLNMRNNLVAWYDDMYKEDRTKSLLLNNLDDVFNNQEFSEIISSSPYPLHNFGLTNFHETQVSRYGDDHHYEFHIDSANSEIRMLSLVYYFNSEPKQWSGGELQLTDSPIYAGKIVDKNAEIKDVIPENNMAVVFGAHTAHGVKPTKSPVEFKDGRFSVNCWIGHK